MIPCQFADHEKQLQRNRHILQKYYVMRISLNKPLFLPSHQNRAAVMLSIDSGSGHDKAGTQISCFILGQNFGRRAESSSMW